jgi:hypothetical protein
MIVMNLLEISHTLIILCTDITFDFIGNLLIDILFSKKNLL